MAEIGSILAYLGTMSLSWVISIVAYLLTAIGIYKMGKNLGFSNPWLSFIPFANVYAFGKVAEQYIKRDGSRSAKFSKILLTLSILITVVAIVLFVIIIAFIVADALSHPDIDAYLESEEFAVNAVYNIVLPLVLGTLAIIGLAIANAVVTYVALWRIFAIFDPETATLYLVLSIFFGILEPIFIFVLRNRTASFQNVQSAEQPIDIM